MATTDINFSTSGNVVGDNARPAVSKAAIEAVLTAYDAVAAAIVAITGDTYSAVTHQFTTGGATGLTHAQWATQATALNAVLTSLVAVLAGVSGTAGDVSVAVTSSAFVTKGQLKAALNNAADVLGQLLSLR